ncbi:MAG: UDP-N-acetylglucosamine 4,6-dehydratase [Candidatus Levybacteria bacterium]|nr:UDP-N-acetylglucosamine 4,6-dehydratase [Candidatus Levybacteria bacterium]
MNLLGLIGRKKMHFERDISAKEEEIRDLVESSSFLVLGGAGSIGQAVCKEIFKRNPRLLHVVDISENNMVELVRDIRSSFGYIKGDFQTFALDIGSREYESFINAQDSYDYVLNLSALKHVRSEKDPYTLMRMVNVNIFNTKKTVEQTFSKGGKKYFCVSTDKATNPVNMMGGSKRIMEMFLMQLSDSVTISTARFANVAFSDGSLLHGFDKRLLKKQPIAAPNDVRRYFVVPQESGELCLMSCLFGENRDIFFPKLNESLHLISFAEIAVNYLENRGFEPYLCESEDEARRLVAELPKSGKWPCLFHGSDTTGEKEFEEFYTKDEEIDYSRFFNIGIIKNSHSSDSIKLADFEQAVKIMMESGAWKKEELVDLFHKTIPDFGHKETGKYLDGKM